MKKIFLIIICCVLVASIKEKAIEDIISHYLEKPEITEYKFSIPSNAKKEIQNTLKQKFFRDKIYYWSINILMA